MISLRDNSSSRDFALRAAARAPIARNENANLATMFPDIGNVDFIRCERFVRPRTIPEDRFAVPAMARIKLAVAKVFEQPVRSLESSRRSQCVARPRMAAYWIAKQTTELSLPQIARSFNRDHTTILHGCKRAVEMLQKSPEFRAKVEQVMEMVRS